MKHHGTTWRLRRLAVAFLGATLVMTACGSTRSDEDIAAAAQGATAQVESTSAGEPEPADVPQAVEAPAPQAPDAPSATEAAPVAKSAAGKSPAATGKQVGAKASDAKTPAKVATNGKAQTTGAAAPSDLGPKDPIRIGSVGTVSGFVGEMFKGSLTAIQIWVRATNARGGINGHQIDLRVVDDGGDPARHRAGIQQLVEKDRVIAIVGDNGFLGLREDSVRYLEQKRVPLIGGDALNELWVTSPMMFPQMAAGNDKLWSQMVAAADSAGQGGKFGSIICTEGPICQDALTYWPKFAKQNGLDVAYVSQMSLTQPTFTAECLAARNAGVKFLMLGMDTNSERRVIASCAQQGYHPTFGLVQVRADMAKDRGIDNSVLVSNVFPWMLNDSPATREFHDVMGKFAPNLGIAYDVSQGWVTAKLFEKVASQLRGTPTSAGLLEALWTLKGETLDGLTSPLTFTRDKPAKRVTCYWAIVAEGGSWTAPNGAKGVCKPRAA